MGLDAAAAVPTSVPGRYEQRSPRWKRRNANTGMDTRARRGAIHGTRIAIGAEKSNLTGRGIGARKRTSTFC